jgi:hypothetical protein
MQGLRPGAPAAEGSAHAALLNFHCHYSCFTIDFRIRQDIYLGNLPPVRKLPYHLLVLLWQETRKLRSAEASEESFLLLAGYFPDFSGLRFTLFAFFPSLVRLGQFIFQLAHKQLVKLYFFLSHALAFLGKERLGIALDIDHAAVHEL